MGKRVGNAEGPASSPLPTIEWELVSWRVTWLGGMGVGRSHLLGSQDAALSLASRLKVAIPEGNSWRVEAIRSRRIDP